MTHCDRVLSMLADHRWHDHMEGYRLGVMLHSRVADLRRRGHVIECDKTGGAYRYRLVSSPVSAPVTGPAGLAAGEPHVSPREPWHTEGCASPAAQLTLDIPTSWRDQG